MSSGVPQGTILAPLLFILFTNDIFNLHILSNITAYADDIKIFGPVSEDHDLSADFEVVKVWCTENSMSINCGKSGVMHFGKNNPHRPYYLDSTLIPVVTIYKDLGIIIDKDLSFSTHCLALTRKCTRICIMIQKSFSKKRPALLAKLFKLYVLPIIRYSSPFLHPTSCKNINLLEGIQRKFTRFSFPHKSNLDYPCRMATLELDPIELHFLKSALIFIFKLLHSDSSIKHILPPLLKSCTRNSSIKFVLPLDNTKLRKSIFPHNIVSIWNALPAPLLSSSSLSHFRLALNSTDLSSFLRGVL